MDIVAELRQVTERLDRAGVDYALCGGLAMAVYALPRATLDIDLLIQAEALAAAERALAPIGYFVGTADMSFNQGKVRMTRLCKVDPTTQEALAEPAQVLPEKRRRRGRHRPSEEHYR